MTSKISYSAIYTFTVVAKELSFTRAAELLHITPSAVSHQMKLLESQLGVSLFHRKSKGVYLSVAGEALQQHANSGVHDIQQGIQQSQFAAQSEKLVIAAIPSFCHLWLLPRIHLFCDAHPAIELEIVALDRLANFAIEAYDAHIHFGSGVYKEIKAKLLAIERIYPVCHPALVRQHNTSSLTRLLEHSRLLHYKAGLEDAPGGVSWADWLNHYHIKPGQNQMWFSHVSMALNAAKQKLGIALGWHHLVNDDIQTGQLIRLSQDVMTPCYRYYLAAPEVSWQNSTFQLFADWLMEQMAESADAE